MAGSYNHAIDNNGKLYKPEDLRKMVGTPNDLYEMAEEMYGMIWYLADSLARSYGNSDTAAIVEEARRNYPHGLDLSPGINGALPYDD